MRQHEFPEAVRETDHRAAGSLRAESVETPPLATARDWIALAVLMLPVLLVSIDNTVLSLALPHIAEALEPDAAQQLWIIDAYSIVLAGLLVTMGSLGDRIGRRRLLLIGAAGFAVFSVASAFATTALELILLRGLTGVFGAMLMPSTLALIRGIFRDRNQRRVAIAVWAGCFSAGSAAGPLVGGVVLEHFHWNAIFLIALPVLLPLFILTPLLVRESRDPHPGPIDVPGMLASIVALVAIVLGIKEFAAQGFGLQPIVSIVVGFAVGAWFVRRQLRRPVPLLDLTLFRNPLFSGSIAVNLLSVVSMVGFLFFVSQHLQIVVGLTPLAAGVVLLPGIVLMIIAGFAVVPLSKRVTARVIITGSVLLSATAYVLMAAFGAGSAWQIVLIAFVILGVGVGMAETLSNDLILSAAPKDRAGAASALSETAYEVGAVLGTALLGGLLTAHYRGALVVPDGVDTDAGARARETLAGAEQVAASLPNDLGAELMSMANAAFEGGVVMTSVIGAILMVAAAAAAWFVLPKR